MFRRFATTDGAKENLSYFDKSKYFYRENHIICFLHTIHNSIIGALEEIQIVYNI
jgi:hypothetical protein